MWLACFAWLVGLLYACGVRRFYGLLRVCLPFVLLPLSFCLSFYLFTCFLSFILPSLFWLSFACPLACLICSCVFIVSFSLADYTQKERARRVGASSLVLLWIIDLVGVRFPVLVKFVIVSVNLFGDTFIGNCIFVIISPLLEKTFKNAIDKFPGVKFVLYALFYVI